jgi:hypothetical protein
LGITGRQLAAAAPSLQRTFDRIEPFRRAAAPALETIRTKTADKLLRLGVDSTPTMFKIGDTVKKLRALAQTELPPVGGALDKSMDNLLAVLENWSRAIQFRDRLGHVFRGEATIAPDLYESVIGRLAKTFGAKATSRKRSARSKRAKDRPAVRLPELRKPGVRVPKLDVGEPTRKLREKLSEIVGRLPALQGGQGSGSPRSTENQKLTPLLDYLLG